MAFDKRIRTLVSNNKGSVKRVGRQRGRGAWAGQVVSMMYRRPHEERIVSMTANEASGTRERLSLSVEHLAADLDLTPDVVRAWEQWNCACASTS